MTTLALEWDDDEWQRAVARLIDAGANLRPLMAEIGSELEASTRERFRTESDPDGVPWLKISDAWKRRKERLGFNAGILKMRGDLVNSVQPDPGDDYVEISVGDAKGRWHQEGTGLLPARPFIGVSREDAAGIMDATLDYLQRAIDGR